MTKYVYHYCAEHRIETGLTRFTGIVSVDNRINAGDYDGVKVKILDGNNIENIVVDKLEIISLSFLHKEAG